MSKKSKSGAVINAAIVAELLKIVDKGLCDGLGGIFVEGDDKEVGKPGDMCVEAAVCYAFGEPHGDHPSCVNDNLARWKINLNDEGHWKSKKSRAAGLRRLAVAQLGTKKGYNHKTFLKDIENWEQEQQTAQIIKELEAALVKAKKTKRFTYDEADDLRHAVVYPEDALEGTEKRSIALAEAAVQALIKQKTPGSKFLYLTEKGGKKKSKK